MRVTILLCLLFLSACTTVGPKTLARDQFDYVTAMSTASQEQLLRNIIKLRYLESPVFVKVSSVISQYTLESQVSLRAGFDDSFTGGNTQSLGGTGKWSDKPTITFSPLTGRVFSQSLLTPLPPDALFALVQAGWPAEVLFRIAIRSMNGVNNEVAAPAFRQAGDPEFREILTIWQRLRKARAIGLRRAADAGTAQIFAYQTSDSQDPAILRDLERLGELLGVSPRAEEFLLSYGLVPKQPEEVAILTASILEIMADLAWRLDAPAEHVADGRTGPTFQGNADFVQTIRIHSSRDKPETALVRVRERGYWFYIDDRDLRSKRTFGILQILLSLTESDEGARAPLVTISN